MNQNANTILIVDDDQAMRVFLRKSMEKIGYQIIEAVTENEAITKLEQHDIDVILTDLNLEEGNGISVCKRALMHQSDLPVILLTAFGDLKSAVRAIRVGAFDFLSKPVDLEVLKFSISKAIKHQHLTSQLKDLQNKIDKKKSAIPSLIGSSTKMKKVISLIQRLADSDASVLITGESGTGKELVAKALHQQSNREKGPFIPINCAAMPSQLLESELFGHKKGAFTDAHRDRKGLFVQADQGTLFLDEIGELPLEMQPKLLRALQESKVRPIGSNDLITFNTRIIAATNRDLEESIEEGSFREDLFYRINVVTISLPPLRDRGNDILLLAQHFLERFSSRIDKPVKGIVEPAAEKLLTYDWPGNVRELQNCMEHAVTLSLYDQIQIEDLPSKIRDFRSSQIPTMDETSEQDLPTLETLQMRYIRKVLKMADNNKSKAARILGLDRRTLYRKLQDEE